MPLSTVTDREGVSEPSTQNSSVASAMAAVSVRPFRQDLLTEIRQSHDAAGATGGVDCGERRRKPAGDVTEIVAGRLDGWPAGSVGQ